MSDQEETLTLLRAIQTDLSSVRSDVTLLQATASTTQNDISYLSMEVNNQATRLKHLTDLSTTLHNKVDAVRVNQDLARDEVKTAIDSIADVRRDLIRHEHP